MLENFSRHCRSIGAISIPRYRWKYKPVYGAVKFGFDILTSLLILMVAALPMIVIAITVRCTSRGPALFRQKRCGKNGKVFTLLKFRSMFTEAPADLPSDELQNPEALITPFGRFLRKTSLDELPQLFNVLAGQMSLIGPRPALTVNQDLLLRLRVENGSVRLRPGLTGWAQVNGRDLLAADTRKKAEYDGYYAERCSFWLDTKIFCLTVVKVLFHSDVVEGDRSKAENVVAAMSEERLAAAESAAALDEPERKPRKRGGRAVSRYET